MGVIISDVFSIGMNMTFNPYISTMYILSSISGHKNCDGGNPYEILEKIENEGIATNICVSYENACLDYGNCDNNMIPSKGCCNNQVDHYLYFISNIRVETDINLIKQHIEKKIYLFERDTKIYKLQFIMKYWNIYFQDYLYIINNNLSLFKVSDLIDFINTEEYIYHALRRVE